MQKIVPFLWFDTQAEEAVKFYTGIFKKSKINKVTRYTAAGAEASGRPKDSIMTVEFHLEGQPFVALNGGSAFHFTPALSLVVHCKTQAEIDRLWKNLSSDPNGGQCGWLTDKYGVSWQIVPAALGKLLEFKDPKKSDRVMEALIKMKKLQIDVLKEAASEK